MPKKTFTNIALSCLLLISLSSVIFSDFIIYEGKIVNDNSGGNLIFDLSDDSVDNAGVTMTADGKIGIGVDAPISTFDLNGTVGFSRQTFSSNANISGNTFVFGDTTSGNITLTLPTAVSVPGRIYQIKKLVTANDLIITASSNIDKVPSITLSTSAQGFPYLNVYSSGTQWFVTSKSN